MGRPGEEVFAAHDPRRLTARWRLIARRTGLGMRAFAESGGQPVWVLGRGRGGFYISAGIHGDEPAGCEALAVWAEESADFLAARECVIFPCLNPWGLLHNSRLDERGRDLNRCYDRAGVAVISKQRRLLRGRHFHLALTLHEDFDARGVYLYEVAGPGPGAGERLLAAAANVLPVETRRRVEGLACRGGLIRRRRPPAGLEGLPEALWLRGACCPRVFTLETPSEMDLRERVAAQVAALREFERLCREGLA
ncbi:MAG: M14 family metallocarboxypeptidase [Terrimicrobiaceae bacterium]|nr:M14 family metallocarboxypeptidase [Terrimicrobiaceae bacterium]